MEKVTGRERERKKKLPSAVKQLRNFANGTKTKKIVL